MDVTGIANVATALAAQRTADDVGVAVLKKAMDTQAQGVLALIQALPAPAAPNLPAHLGRNVDTTA
jgi:Putative motility protein